MWGEGSPHVKRRPPPQGPRQRGSLAAVATATQPPFTSMSEPQPVAEGKGGKKLSLTAPPHPSAFLALLPPSSSSRASGVTFCATPKVAATVPLRCQAGPGVRCHSARPLCARAKPNQHRPEAVAYVRARGGASPGLCAPPQVWRPPAFANVRSRPPPPTNECQLPTCLGLVKRVQGGSESISHLRL